MFGARLEDGAFVDDTDVGLFAFQQSVGNSFADLAPDGVDPFVTASQNGDDELKTDFVIDIAAAAEALAGEDATSAEQIATSWQSSATLALSRQKMLMVRWWLVLLSGRVTVATLERIRPRMQVYPQRHGSDYQI